MAFVFLTGPTCVSPVFRAQRKRLGLSMTFGFWPWFAGPPNRTGNKPGANDPGVRVGNPGGGGNVQREFARLAARLWLVIASDRFAIQKECVIVFSMLA